MNCPKIQESCPFGEFTGGEEVLQVFAVGADIHVEQHSEEFLGEPEGLLLDANLDAGFTCVGGEDEELGGAVAEVGLLARSWGVGGGRVAWAVLGFCQGEFADTTCAQNHQTPLPIHGIRN